MQNTPNPKQIGAIQNLITKNPVAFAAAVFFIMFWVTYLININKSSSDIEYFKKKLDEIMEIYDLGK